MCRTSLSEAVHFGFESRPLARRGLSYHDALSAFYVRTVLSAILIIRTQRLMCHHLLLEGYNKKRNHDIIITVNIRTF